MEDHCIEIESETCLKCPKCGDHFLHHGDVDVHSRKKEDEDGYICKARYSGVEVLPLKAKDFLGRRNSLLIGFRCETCGPIDYSLLLMQNKGITVIKWVR